MKARIVSTGSYLGECKVTNEDLSKIMDTNDEWIQQRTGVKSRLYSEHNTAEMSYRCAIDILNRANFDKNDLDLIIVATFSPDNYTPSVANIVYQKLNLKTNIPSFDINAACSGFVYALNVARSFIESNIYQNILVIGAENLSKFIDFNNRSTGILFADGASGVLLKPDTIGIDDLFVRTLVDDKKTIIVPTGIDINTPFTKNITNQEARLSMNGQEVFKFASKAIVNSINEILTNNNLDISEIKWIICHQANARIIEFASKILKISTDKFYMNVDQLGNTSAASIPLVLDELDKNNLIEKEDKIIMVAFGSGLTYGACLVQY